MSSIDADIFSCCAVDACVERFHGIDNVVYLR